MSDETEREFGNVLVVAGRLDCVDQPCRFGFADVEGGSVLKVGPRSAGADPGPACYGKGGTEPTVTDANVVLGRVGHRPLGGAIRLDPERARVAVADLATRLGIADVATMAEGIVRLVVAEMTNAIREISIERGYDPARFTLVPFDGAGPMHATRIAAELGMRRVLVPLDPGNLSALGTRARASSSPSISPARRASPTTVRRAFLEAYARQYGHAHASGDIEIVNLRTTVIGVTPKPRGRRDDLGNLRFEAVG